MTHCHRFEKLDDLHNEWLDDLKFALREDLSDRFVEETIVDEGHDDANDAPEDDASFRISGL